eukprot:TRINITY_DN494_c0_g1_i4.p1 TRINITY_DN494_c0_g1~~TRINITY_DN494_c0_g1_i4.p1  ORF type:complete len:101 (+),score=24.22 TRINITY_DN494_c0_g1_i4:67-369(+)
MCIRDRYFSSTPYFLGYVYWFLCLACIYSCCTFKLPVIRKYYYMAKPIMAVWAILWGIYYIIQGLMGLAITWIVWSLISLYFWKLFAQANEKLDQVPPPA